MIRFFNVYYPKRTVVLLLFEALLTAGCFVAAAFFLAGRDAPELLSHQFGLLRIGIVTLLSIFFSYYCDLYEPQIVSARQAIYLRIVMVLAIDCCTVTILLHLYRVSGSAASISAVGLAILTPVLLLWRRIYEWLLTISALRERVYVLGSGEFARSIIEAIESRPELGMDVVNREDVDDESPEDRRKIWRAALQRIGDASQPASRVIVALEKHRGELPVEELLKLRFKGIVVEDVHTLRERLSGKIHLEGLLPSTFLYAEGFRLKSKEQLLRQVLSTVAAAVGLLLFLPFFPFVVLAVRLSSKGPIFFRQTRVGVGNKVFEVIKFRSMFIDAEAGGPRWATENDARITRVGSLLRKSHIDEIPQLWNVLCGDMGIVGPRPERPEFIPMLAEALPFYYMRHLIRPGLTGWAQVRFGYGASLAETKEKLEYDLYYIKHMSFGLDTLILFETIKTVLRRRGSR